MRDFFLLLKLHMDLGCLFDFLLPLLKITPVIDQILRTLKKIRNVRWKEFLMKNHLWSGRSFYAVNSCDGGFLYHFIPQSHFANSVFYSTKMILFSSVYKFGARGIKMRLCDGCFVWFYLICAPFLMILMYVCMCVCGWVWRFGVWVEFFVSNPHDEKRWCSSVFSFPFVGFFSFSFCFFSFI